MKGKAFIPWVRANLNRLLLIIVPLIIIPTALTERSDLPATLSVGTYSVIWTAEDASENVKTCTVDIEIVSDLYPSITCLGDQSKGNDAGECEYTVDGTELDVSSSSSGANTCKIIITVDLPLMVESF